MSVQGVARGGLFVFVGTFVAAIVGYVFWFFVSILSNAEVVGTAESVVSLSALVSGIAVFGIPTGMQRFLGREFSRNRMRSLNIYFWSSFVFAVAMCLISGSVIALVGLLNIPFIGFTKSMLLAAGIMTFINFFYIMTALFASIIRTEYTAISSVSMSIVKLGLGVFLVYIGFGWLGAVSAIILASLFMVGLMLFFASRELRRLGGMKLELSAKAARDSIRAGLVSWLPTTIGLLGQQLAILTVWGIQGGTETGLFFICYAIFSIVNTLPISFMSILFPILSGLGNEGSIVARKALRVCLALTCPLAAFLAIYSRFPLSLMGGQYTLAAQWLSLLVLSTIPITLIGAVNSLAYARGFYRKVLGIGLTINIPQVALYFLLVPPYGGLGAALSFLMGSLVGLTSAAYVSKKIHFGIPLKKASVAILIPFIAGLFCYLILMDWPLAAIIILTTSLLCYGRLGVVERSDLAEIARAFASENTIAKAGRQLNWLLRIMYGA